MRFASIVAVLFFLATFALGAPIPAPAKPKGKNLIKAAAAAKNAPPPVDKPTPAVGSVVKVTPAKGVAPHPAIVIGGKAADGTVPVAQLTHAGNSNPFTAHAKSSDIIPSLSSAPDFDNTSRKSQSIVNVGAPDNVHVNNISPSKVTSTATSDEVDNIKNTISKVASGGLTGEVSSVATDVKNAASSGVVGDAEKAASDVASDVEDASKSGVLGDVEKVASDASKSGLLGDVADVAEHLRSRRRSRQPRN